MLFFFYLSCSFLLPNLYILLFFSPLKVCIIFFLNCSFLLPYLYILCSFCHHHCYRSGLSISFFSSLKHCNYSFIYLFFFCFISQSIFSSLLPHYLHYHHQCCHHHEMVVSRSLIVKKKNCIILPWTENHMQNNQWLKTGERH